MPFSTDMKRLILLVMFMSFITLLAACQGEDSTTEAPKNSIAAFGSTAKPAENETTKAPTVTTAVTTAATTAETTAHTPTVQVIPPEKAKEMMEKGGVIIVDVRREDEYAEGHIEGALLVPNETITEQAETMLPDKGAVYLIYCRSGRRSNEAANKLIALGYQNVYDFGGILSWEYGTVS